MPLPSYAARRVHAVLVLAAVVLAVLVLVGACPAPVEAPAPVARTVTDARVGPALAVLHGWDTRRLAAWRRSDPRDLRHLYVRGSAAGAADLRLLREYDDHGLVVSELRTQVFGVRVVRRERGLLRLRVFDRVAGGVLVRAGEQVPLRSSRPVTRELELRRVRGAWRLASSTPVSGWAPAPRAGRR
jgi:hypothetical protein